MNTMSRSLAWGAGATALAVAIGLAVPPFVDALRVLGRHIPQSRIEYDYLMGLLWAVALTLSIRLWPVAAADKRPLLIVWLCKVLVVLVAMLPYEWNYTLDAYGYFERSEMPGLPVATSAWGRGNALVAQFAWLHARVMPDSYHALKVSFALVGLIAVYLMYRGAVRLVGREDRRVLYFIALFPSVLFWSSIIGKDPLHLLGIGLYVYGVLSWRATGRTMYAIPIVAGVALSFAIRSWSGPILLFPLLVFAIFGIRRPALKVLYTIAAVAGFLWAVSYFAATFNIETLRDVHTAAESRSQGWAGGSAQERTERFTGIGSMLRFAPWGAFTALFRPLPGEVRNPFGLLAGVENVFLLLLLASAIVRARPRVFREPAVVWGVMLVLTWSFVYSFVSYYNFGAAVRFKLQILPILLLVLLYLRIGPATWVGALTPARNSGGG